MKDKAFARKVNREDIRKGAEELGVELSEHFAFCIEAMRGIAGGGLLTIWPRFLLLGTWVSMLFLYAACV